MRALLVAGVVACASCHGWTGRRIGYTDCHQRTKPGAAAAGPVAIPDADPAFAQLRGFRNYYDIDGVGAYEHHFAVWFSCVEQSVSYYAVAEDGSVRDAGGAWGGLAVRGDGVPEIPADQRANADKIAAQHEADYDGASEGRIEYLGSYREVRVTERVPSEGPKDPYARMMAHTTVTLRANAELSAFDGYAGLEGGDTRICWKEIAYGDCGPQRWFDFTPARGVGEAQLAALVSPKSPQPDDERARFGEAVLAAARGFDAGPTSIDPILAAQGTSMLPPGFAPPAVVGFTIYGRVTQGDQPSGNISVELSPITLLAGAVTGRGSAKVGGVTITADVALELVDGVISDEDGVVEADVRLRYTLTDDRGNARPAELAGHVKALVDQDAAVLTEITFPDLGATTHDPPGSQEFPAAGEVTQFDTYLGVSARRATWYFAP